MTLLAPLFLYLGIAAAAAAVGLHFIVTRQPPSSTLPTARFVPKSTVQVTTLARPQDLLLLLLRVVTLLLIGLAFARPVMVPERRPVARIVLTDISRGVRAIDEVRDSARALLSTGDVLIAFDSAAYAQDADAQNALAALEHAQAAARFSPALIAALRSAADLRADADSIEIAIVSSFRASALDAATPAIRTLWPGRIRLVQVAPADSLAHVPGITVRADDGDGVLLAAALDGATAGDSAVRVVRGAATPADSAWAADATRPGRTLVRWPAEGPPPGWQPRARTDTVGAVVAGDAALVYPLQRRWQPADASARVVARWVDGETAATEMPAGAGCIRDVAVPVPERGDVVLRPSFARLVRALSQPCRDLTTGPALAIESLRTLAGEGPLAARDAIAPPEDVATPIVPWLVAGALLLALLELRMRRAATPARVIPDAAPVPAEIAA